MVQKISDLIKPNLGEAILAIDALTFKKMIIESVSLLRERHEYLNSINVFPVPDGDTGSNMLYTMMGVKDSLEVTSVDSFKAISQKIVKAILLSARGNSGVILSEYFEGFMAEVGSTHVLTSNKLVKALVSGSDYAWRALDDPQRGTILDVFLAAAEGAELALKDTKDIVQILDTALKYSLIALERTRDIQPQMKKAQVVDAGGAGFLCMLEGFRAGLTGSSPISSEDLIQKPVVLQEEELPFHYCAEAILMESSTSRDEIRRRIENLGNSIHVVADSGILKLHIHTNRPEVVEKICREIGRVEEWKVDDLRLMQKQYLKNLQASGGTDNMPVSAIPKSVAKKRIAIVTDRSSDLPDGWLQQYPIIVVDIPVTLSSDPTDLSEKNTLKEFYDKMANEKDFVPLTAQPNVEQFVDAYKKALDLADIVFCLPVSSGLSGAYSNAIQAKIKLGSDRVNVIDSNTISLGLAMLIKSVFDIQRDKESYLDTLIELHAMRDRMEQYFVVDNIRYLARGGRLSKGKSLLGQVLHVNPLLQIKDGCIKETGKKAYFSNPEKQMIMLARQTQRAIAERDLKFLYIVHADAEDRALMLKKHLECSKNVPEGLIQIAEIGMVLGAHIGPGAVAICWA
jgi:DegV family protein with EDD domain